MKKRLLSFKNYITIILVVAVLLCLPVSANADNTGICFTSTGDILLDLSLSPVYYNGTAYVSARVFANLGIYYNYFASDLTAQLYNNSRSIFLDMDVNTSYDAKGNEYQVYAVYRNGVTYVPVAWTCSYFGLSYSYINGSGYGDVLRIKNGSEVLTDGQFLNAATTLMQSRYNEYYGYYDHNDDSQPPSTTEAPNTPTSNKQGAIVTLSFIGLPSGSLLDTFDRYGLIGCFFITAEEARNNPDTVRRIAGSGHSLGIYSSSNPSVDINGATDTIFRVAQVLPTMVTSPQSIENESKYHADNNAFAYYKPDYYITEGTSSLNNLLSWLDYAPKYSNICFSSVKDGDKLLASLLHYLTTNKFSVIALRETSI